MSRLPLGVWVREWRSRRAPVARPWRPGYRPERLEVVVPPPRGVPEGVRALARVRWRDGTVYEYGLEDEAQALALARAEGRRGVAINAALVLVPGLWVRRVA
jgi:hypothetical protein